MSHDTLADRLWFVRRRGQVLGPFSVTELRKLRDRGNLAVFDEVSEDRSDWIRFERLEELLSPSPPQSAVQEAVSSQSGMSTYPAKSLPPVRDYRTTALALVMVWMGHLIEMLAALCVLSFIIVLIVDGKVVVAGVLILLWSGLTLAYQIVLAIGYGLAAGGSSDAGPKTLPTACLVMQIVDFLLVVIFLILAMISGSVMNVFQQAQEPVIQVAGPLLLGGRMILWVPMTIVLVEWLNALVARVLREERPGRGLSQGMLGQAKYFYVLYVMQNMTLALAFMLSLLYDERINLVHRTNDKVALTFLLICVVYVMLAIVVGIWRIALVIMTRRCLGTSQSRNS